MPDFTTPDYDPNVTFNAAGRAISTWETLEAHLSYLYSILVGKPLLIEAMKEYGRTNRIFEQRMRALCDVSEFYFTKQPSQDHESEINTIITEARRLSTYRNQIAHGVVVAIMEALIMEKNEDFDDAAKRVRYVYCLVPPWHGVFHLNKGDNKYYRLGSYAISAYIEEFGKLSQRVEILNKILNPHP